MNKTTIYLFLSTLVLMIHPVHGVPHTLSILVLPPYDTILAGDSVRFFAGILDDTGGVRTQEFEAYISWSVSPVDNWARVTPTSGSATTFHANVAHMTYTVYARFFDPAIMSAPLVDSAWVSIKPGPIRQYFIEPYTAAISPVPNPVDSIVLGDFPPAQEIYAVLRDEFGNWAGFDTAVTWSELGDSGIVNLVVFDKPYVCRIEKVRPGTTYVVCKSGGSVVGTVKVIVKPGTHVLGIGRLSAVRNQKVIREFFNLRGQRLPHYGIRHADGIVLERVIESSGKASVRKKITPWK